MEIIIGLLGWCYICEWLFNAAIYGINELCYWIKDR